MGDFVLVRRKVQCNHVHLLGITEPQLWLNCYRYLKHISSYRSRTTVFIIHFYYSASVQVSASFVVTSRIIIIVTVDQQGAEYKSHHCGCWPTRWRIQITSLWLLTKKVQNTNHITVTVDQQGAEYKSNHCGCWPTRCRIQITSLWLLTYKVENFFSIHAFNTYCRHRLSFCQTFCQIVRLPHSLSIALTWMAAIFNFMSPSLWNQLCCINVPYILKCSTFIFLQNYYTKNILKC